MIESKGEKTGALAFKFLYTVPGINALNLGRDPIDEGIDPSNRFLSSKRLTMFGVEQENTLSMKNIKIAG